MTATVDLTRPRDDGPTEDLWPSPGVVLGWLLVAAVAFAAATIGLVMADAAGSAPDGFLAYSVLTSAEGNLAAWYASALLLIAGLLAALIGYRARRRTRPDATGWLVLGGLLVAASADEASQFHEKVPGPLRDAFEQIGLGATAGRLAAVAVIVVALAALAALLGPWARGLPGPVFRRLAIGAGLFVGAALGLEVVARLLGGVGVDSVTSARILSAMEELGEMAGSALVVSTLLAVVARVPGTEPRPSAGAVRAAHAPAELPTS